MQLTDHAPHTAVIGAGLAGAACAQALAQAGHRVQVFDKARGAGGRLATRRMAWTDVQSRPQLTRFDHGAPAFTAHSAGFQAFVDQALQAGLLAPWQPRLAPGSSDVDGQRPRYLPLPDMPALCRHLLQGLATHWACPIDRLQRRAMGWQLWANGQALPDSFDQVVLALPPAQATALLGPHHIGWARQAAIAPMQPCWTLMGVSATPEPLAPALPDWDLALAPTGILASAMRQDGRPGRAHTPGQAHWVLHARASWSRQHLEQPADWVQDQLQAALADLLGAPVPWLHSVVHRWRYAQPQATSPSAASRAPTGWWDDAQGLGVCGDFLGSCGVEGAWRSARALADAMLGGTGARPDAAGLLRTTASRSTDHDGTPPTSRPTPSPAEAP